MLVVCRLPRGRGFLLFFSFNSVRTQVRNRFLHSTTGAIAAVLAMSGIVTAGRAFAQDQTATLAGRSSIIVLGKVVKTNASDEPLVASSGRTVLISVQKMLAGAEIAGDQTGKIVTVILSRPEGAKEGEEMLFFGNPRFLGKSLTIADEGEVPSRSGGPSTRAALERGAQVRRDRPIRERLALASLVFRGIVDSVRPLELEGTTEREKRPVTPPTEHDPDWQVAGIRVATPLQGGKEGQIVTVLFAASRDITWFNSPKLTQGQEAVFIAHAPIKQEQPLYRASGLTKFLEKQTVYLVTEPFDVLQPSEETRVRSLLATSKETRQ
jgi:hypothetical protein